MRFKYFEAGVDSPQFRTQLVDLRLDGSARCLFERDRSDERPSAARRFENALLLECPNRSMRGDLRNGVVVNQRSQGRHLGADGELPGHYPLPEVIRDLHVSRARVVLVECHPSSVSNGALKAPQADSLDRNTLGHHHGAMVVLLLVKNKAWPRRAATRRGLSTGRTLREEQPMRVKRTARACPDEGADALTATVAPLPEHQRARLREYWSQVVEIAYATAGEPLPGPRFNAPERAVRRAARRRTAQTVRVIPAAQERASRAMRGAA